MIIPLMRKDTKQLLTIDPNFSVIAEAQNGIENVSYAKILAPDLRLLGYNMQVISGLETIKV